MIRGITRTEINASNGNIALLILRITTASYMLTHGWPKFLRLLDGNMRFGDPLGIGSEVSLVLAVLGEFVGSILIFIGLYTRIGAFLGACTMATAAFIAHAGDPFGDKEKALLFLTAYLVMMIMGSGKYSLDNRLKN